MVRQEQSKLNSVHSNLEHRVSVQVSADAEDALRHSVSSRSIAV